MLQGFKVKSDDAKEKLDAIAKDNLSEKDFIYSLSDFVSTRIYKEKLTSDDLIANDDYLKVFTDCIQLAKNRQNQYDLETTINGYNNIHYMVIQLMSLPYGNYLKDYIKNLTDNLSDKDNIQLYYIKNSKTNLDKLLSLLA